MPTTEKPLPVIYMEFMEAIKSGNLKEADRLVAQYKFSINKTDGSGNSALHWAVINNHFPTVKFLVERSADVDLRDNRGDCALFFAARDGRFDIVKYLVEKGAKISQTNEGGKSALGVARDRGYAEIANYLEERKKQQQSSGDSKVPCVMHAESLKPPTKNNNTQCTPDTSTYSPH